MPNPAQRRRRRSSLLVLPVVLVFCAAAATPAAAQSRPGDTGGHGSVSRHGDDSYQQLNLVSDIPGKAQSLDPNLVNPWGLSASPTSPLWVSDNGSDKSTLYSGANAPGTPVTTIGLVVAIPGGGAPTGQVFNSTPDFLLPTGGKALFIFAGEDGDLSAWNGAQGSTAVTVAPSVGGVYKGLALLATGSANRLLAANFHDNRIDVFDSAFTPITLPGAFRSVGIPHGYAPFNVAVLGDRVYVSYAKQDATKHDDVAGAGHGYVNAFDTAGRFVKRLANHGVLNSPWGMAIAPAGFGDLSGQLLVGNFGDGRIHAFGKPGGKSGDEQGGKSGDEQGGKSGDEPRTLRGENGRPLVIDGLWGLLPGNGNSGASSDVWFSAGPDGESHGLLGILRASEQR